VCAREDGQRVGADLVRGVAVSRDAVGADDDAVDSPLAMREPALLSVMRR
jgi:hypothetical protein